MFLLRWIALLPNEVALEDAGRRGRPRVLLVWQWSNTPEVVPGDGPQLDASHGETVVSSVTLPLYFREA